MNRLRCNPRLNAPPHAPAAPRRPTRRPPRAAPRPPAPPRARTLTSSRAVFNKLMGRELVGRDAHGNHYYLFFESKGAKPRRQVDYKDGDIEPETIPPEWRAWLWNSRETVPTETELAKGVADRAKFAARVQEIENADKKERMRMQKGQEAKSQEGGGKPENVYLARAMSKIEGDAKASGRPRVS